jgi:hypothetical protein
VNILKKLLRCLNPPTDPELEEQSQRMSNRRAMIRGSQDSPYFSASNLPPPTRIITDPHARPASGGASMFRWTRRLR